MDHLKDLANLQNSECAKVDLWAGTAMRIGTAISDTVVTEI